MSLTLTAIAETKLTDNPPKPAELSKRIDSIDITRGIALLGILLLNIASFSMPQYYQLAFLDQTDNPDYWIKGINDVFFEGKMRALFSAVFGAGIILFISNKEKSGQQATWLFYKRMIWLTLFGFAHSYLSLWSGDILYCYGLIGMLVYFFRKMKPRYLSMGVVIVAGVNFVLGLIYYQGIREKRLNFNEAIAVQEAGGELTEQHQTAIAIWNDQSRYLLPNEENIAYRTAQIKSSYTEFANYVRPIIWDRQTKQLFYRIWDMFALILLGCALYKWGFFTMKWTKAQYKRTIWIGYGIGLPLAIFSFIYYDKALSNPETFVEQNPVNWAGLIYDIQRISIMMAHVAVLILLYQKGYLKRLAHGVRAVGQMAFTNYIMHTVICALVFFGYGLNQYAEWRYHQLFYLVIGIWLFQLITSTIWLRYFQFGPLEWLWRCLTYGKIQPFRKESST